jgi:hypothetical protein
VTQFNETQHNDNLHNDTQHNDTLHNDTKHNDTQHNDTQHNDTQHNDTQHNGLFATLIIKDTWINNIMTLSNECRYAERRDYLNALLSVVMLSAVILSVTAPIIVYSEEQI